MPSSETIAYPSMRLGTFITASHFCLLDISRSDRDLRYSGTSLWLYGLVARRRYDRHWATRRLSDFRVDMLWRADHASVARQLVTLIFRGLVLLRVDFTCPSPPGRRIPMCAGPRGVLFCPWGYPAPCRPP